MAIVAALMAASALTACTSGTTGGNQDTNPAPTQNSECRGYTFDPPGCPDSTAKAAPPSVSTVKANPPATNPGVGHVSGICRFSIQSPSGDKGVEGSGLRPKKMNETLINIVGFVYGYCTDIIHDFTLDMHIYGGPPGTAQGGTDFTKNKRAHELVYREVKTPIPGPIPVPYAITMPCVPGLEMQLIYTLTARDDPGNFIGGGPYGGNIVSFTREQCGAAT